MRPLIPSREAANAITWGGAAACRDCRFQRKHFEQDIGERLPQGSCYRNIQQADDGSAIYGGCLHPEPVTNPSLAGLWSVWRLTHRKQDRVGMEGILQGRNLPSVEVVARNLGVPMDEEFFLFWGVLESAECIQEAKQRKK